MSSRSTVEEFKRTEREAKGTQLVAVNFCADEEDMDLFLRNWR